MLLAACATHRRTDTQQHPGTEPAPTTSHDKPHDVAYQGTPWVINLSSPHRPAKGLYNRHIALWSSHGRYYNQEKDKWLWQRPNLFCTNEDLFTQTIVTPYLIPMLERAGANVFTPRERDWQPHEVVVDNDSRTPSVYTERQGRQRWQKADEPGFASLDSLCADGVNPFRIGTARMAKATDEPECDITYQPLLPQSGQYAVYVSYAPHRHNVPDAQYTVYHQGRATTFSVNQQMGAGTWVYLGTFSFDKGCSERNRVVLTNKSRHRGVVTADAVRFGGGMGNVVRGGTTSGLPRCLEAARYYAQWAGAPDSVYLSKGGTDDYKEDINTRSYMTNWLAGGSVFNPHRQGLGVPVELSLAVHSDAGTQPDFRSVHGSLAICTTNTAGGLLATGLSRNLSKDFAQMLLQGLDTDLTKACGQWNIRDLYDRNYSETRCPVMPSAIIETLSHQNFPDMRLGHDPNFRFTLARSLYKTILRFNAKTHHTDYVVAPLAPQQLCAEFYRGDTLTIRWQPQTDDGEPTARPDAYILYTAAGQQDYDNGIRINGTACRLKLQPDLLYRFKVTAVNEGGESFDSEELAAVFHAPDAPTILVVNGFQRLAAPAVVDTDSAQGFDFNADYGMPWGKTYGYCGAQLHFAKQDIGREGAGALGYCGSEWEGKAIMGNTFDYAATHARAMMSASRYNIVSCSKQAVMSGQVNLLPYHAVDLILGMEKADDQSIVGYKTFPIALQRQLTAYVSRGGHIIASGSFIASDMRGSRETEFLQNVLHITPGDAVKPTTPTIQGMGTQFGIYTCANDRHYAATTIDTLVPAGEAFAALTDQQGRTVAVAFGGPRSHSFAMGFPFECITDSKKRNSIMRGILDFLFK